MKVLRKLKYFSKKEVPRSKKGIFISQRKYILDLLTEIGMLERKPILLDDEPWAEGEKMIDQTQYQKLVGKLIDYSHTRPDLAYAV